jgi:hypothetical protein
MKPLFSKEMLLLISNDLSPYVLIRNINALIFEYWNPLVFSSTKVLHKGAGNVHCPSNIVCFPNGEWNFQGEVPPRGKYGLSPVLDSWWIQGSVELFCDLESAYDVSHKVLIIELDFNSPSQLGKVCAYVA